MRSLRQILLEDTAALALQLGIERSTARLEVQSLLQQVLDCNRAWLLSHDDAKLSKPQAELYSEWLGRRLRGEPLAYVLGEREFFGLMFKVTPDTLIPRSDTETLVEQALRHLPEQGRVLDLGVGSGAIALSIAHARPDAAVIAVDASITALAVASENAERLQTGNVNFLASNWFAALADERFDLIVSNPPYIAEGDPHLLRGDLRFEPQSALSSGNDGLDDVRRIIFDAPAHLLPGGWLLLEHGYDQACAVRALLRQVGLSEIFSSNDLAGIERVSGGRLPLDGLLPQSLKSDKITQDKHLMQIREIIHQQVTSHPVVLYMKGTPQFPQCGFSGNAVRILHALGVRDFFSVDVLSDSEIRQGIKDYTNWPTIPQLYIHGEFVGGSDIMGEMFQSGELKQLLAR